MYIVATALLSYDHDDALMQQQKATGRYSMHTARLLIDSTLLSGKRLTT